MEILGQKEVNKFLGVGTYVAVTAWKSEGTVWVVDPIWISKITDVNRIDSLNKLYLQTICEQNDKW